MAEYSEISDGYSGDPDLLEKANRLMARRERQRQQTGPGPRPGRGAVIAPPRRGQAVVEEDPYAGMGGDWGALTPKPPVGPPSWLRVERQQGARTFREAAAARAGPRAPKQPQEPPPAWLYGKGGGGRQSGPIVPLRHNQFGFQMPLVQAPVPAAFQYKKKQLQATAKAQAPAKKRPHGDDNQVSSMPFPTDSPLWVRIPDDVAMPELLGELSRDALALSISGKKWKLCTETDEVLTRFLGEEDVNIVYSEPEGTYEESWEFHPEVGEALHLRIPYAKEQFCIAVCPAFGVWAIGVSDKGRNRFQAARIALAVSIHLQDRDGEASMDVSDLHNFTSFVDSVGAPVDPTEGNLAQMRAAAQAHQTAPKKKQKVVKDEVATEGLVDAAMTLAPGSAPLRDTPFWVELPEGGAAGLEGLPTTALAITTEGKGKKGLYRIAEKLVAHILGDTPNDTEYLDDSDWSDFPEVGAALKELTGLEECLTVAVCHSFSIWAVGAGMRKANRQGAAHLAMATALALHFEEQGLDLDLSEYHNFTEFLEEARSAGAGGK